MRYRSDFPIAVVEAQAYREHADLGLQQAKDYAEILGFKFAYATNGREIIEFDYTSGKQRDIERFPPPEEPWARLSKAENFASEDLAHILDPYQREQGKTPRYDQKIAINRAVQAVVALGA